jgi:DNA-binding MarR family transcriptional regulator
MSPHGSRTASGRIGETAELRIERTPGAAKATMSTAGDAHAALPQLIERLHRRFLDLLRNELSREGVHDIAPVQMLLLLNMDGDDVAIQDLIDRGNYMRSQTFYNIKKLVESGYLEQERSKTDRRTVRIKLTKKATTLCGRLRAHQSQLAELFSKTEDKPDNLQLAYRILRRLERAWDDYLRYGRI